MHKLNITEPNYLKMIDELLFITAQNNRLDTPLLMGAMGLCYPEDTYYSIGGMKAFSEALSSKCSNIFYKHQVQKICFSENLFEVQTNQGSFKCNKVVSTIPIWNHAELFENDEEKKFFNKSNIPSTKNCWSAFMIYLTIPIDKNREGIYFQIHCNQIPYCGTNSFFVSLSHLTDEIRSIKGRQVVTISTHTKYSEWFELDKEEYKKRKKKVELFILEIFKDKFKLTDLELQNVSTGSPKTFVKYTKRFHGLVGGIPHSLKRNLTSFAISKSPHKNFYMI